MKHLKKITESAEDKQLIIIRCDDWEGIYYNDKLINQDHSIDWNKVITELGYNIKVEYIDDEEFLDSLGYLPESLDELKTEIESNKYNL